MLNEEVILWNGGRSHSLGWLVAPLTPSPDENTDPDLDDNEADPCKPEESISFNATPQIHFFHELHDTYKKPQDQFASSNVPKMLLWIIILQENLVSLISCARVTACLAGNDMINDDKHLSQIFLQIGNANSHVCKSAVFSLHYNIKLQQWIS